MTKNLALAGILLIDISLLAVGSSANKGTSPEIDARTLLEQLDRMVKEIPDTKEECQAKLKEIRDWQRTTWTKLMTQPRSPKYGFEYQWVPQSQDRDPNSLACTQVLFSDERAYEGHCSLKMMMDLVEGDEHKSKGEAWVDMLVYPPVGESVPVNLDGRTVSMRIYAPPGARWKPNKPNGVQVFVKDDKGKNQYGSWDNVTEGVWFPISLKVSTFNPPRGHTDLGFDPTRIAVVGVKMGTGEGSKATYQGAIFVDGVNWE